MPKFEIEVFDCEVSWNGKHEGASTLESTLDKAQKMHNRLGGDIEVYEVFPDGFRSLRGRYR